MTPGSMKYQPHIDGLRAVAVATVVLFHIDSDWLPGGFIGVDVFFVISGYLITRMIHEEVVATGAFDYGHFYLRRVRRLFPALFATLFLSFLAAAVLLSPAQFQAFGTTLRAAILSISNIVFWKQSGYFDSDAALKPLLHTWSLSVEEQFYLVWPLTLVLFARGSRTRLLVLIAVLGALSLAAAVAAIDYDRARFGSATFYLTPFRIYEFALGAVGVLIARWMPDRRLLHEAGFALGLALILYASLAFSEEMPFPYAYAAVPCLGALLVILSAKATLVGKLLTNPVAVGIGLASYSAYLVHWPLIVFLGAYTFAPLGIYEKLALVAATALLAALSYFAVERPFRRPRPGSARRYAGVCAALAAATVLLGTQIKASNGWGWRHPGSLTATDVKNGFGRRLSLVRDACTVLLLDDAARCRRDRPIQILFLGNSHENDGYNIFHALYRRNDQVNLISFGTVNDCQPSVHDGKVGTSGKVRQCGVRIAHVSDPAFIGSLDAVVYSSMAPFQRFNQPTWDLLRYMRQINPSLRLIVVGGYFTSKRDCSEIQDRFHSFEACKSPRFLALAPFGERAAGGVDTAGVGDYLYLDKTKLLCPDATPESCLMFANGEPAYYDRHHLSLGFATYIAARVAEVYARDLAALGLPDVSAPIATGSNPRASGR